MLAIEVLTRREGLDIRHVRKSSNKPRRSNVRELRGGLDVMHIMESPNNLKRVGCFAVREVQASYKGLDV